MRRGEGGFTYVAVLAMLAVMSLGLAAIGPMWAEEARRDREAQLLRVGVLYAEAIERYRQSSPGSSKRYPADLEALLLDTRFVGTVRHLRSLYPDPVSARPWGLVRADDGGVRGVFSQSDAAPLHTVQMDLGAVTLPAAQHYSQWQFIAREQP